ncbi:MAG: DUF6370 family protein [Limisphaerales bacterium]
MKVIVSVLVSGWVLLSSGCSPSVSSTPAAVTLSASSDVEAACGRCLFGTKEKGCNLAIRWEGKSYGVDGVSIRQFGNPDIEGGLCKKVHQAKVSGHIEKGRFAADSFELQQAQP